MKVFRHSILLLFALLCGLQGQAQQQRFFNLTVDDIAIDTMLPRFSYAIPLGKHYADSIYTLEIRYPEFLEMGRRDSLRYLALAPSADSRTTARDRAAHRRGPQEGTPRLLALSRRAP